MRFYADLHIHSKYSRATSKNCDLENLALWARRKGIAVVGTGDFTHPAWMDEIKDKLRPAEPGLFKLKKPIADQVDKRLEPALRGPVRFMLTVEISTIYKKGDKTRKVHHLILVPDKKAARKLTRALDKIGNLHSDGRPILGLDSRDLLEITLESGEGSYLIPAHIWTPWFSAMGSKSGFDSIDECYGDLASHIFAVETGLSSDPPMNWRLSALDRYRLVSNSDAHSPAKLGRECCAFDCQADYFQIRCALETGDGYKGTVEMFPEEGKYHLDGHRKCELRMSPAETKRQNGRCPVCGKPATVGVLYRVDELADRDEGARPKGAAGFQSFIPLNEIIGEIMGRGPNTKGVMRSWQQLAARVGPELFLLGEAPIDEIKRGGGDELAEAVRRMRAGEVIREAGYDGEYGVIRLFEKGELESGKGAGLLFELPEAEREPRKKKPKKKSSAKKPGQPKPSGKAAPKNKKKADKKSRGALGDLDGEQAEAAAVVDRPLLIVAGPGAGKTRTLTHRIACLVKEKKARPEHCLAVTFTRRAAAELKDRLEALLGKGAARVQVMTFHALGLSLLREHGSILGLPPRLRVASEDQRMAILKKAVPPKSKPPSKRKLKKLAADISRAKRGDADVSPDLDQVRAAYEQGLRARGMVDFDDLIALSAELIESDPGVMASVRDRYRYVSIDEYQDVDREQYRLVRALCPPDSPVCAIGDPDQAIYGFRGSDVSFFLRFQEDFPAAKVVSLKRNYRSGRRIVDASLQMISPASLVSGRTQDALGDAPELIAIQECATERAEAEFVVHSIERAIGGSSFFSMDSGRVGAGEGGDCSFSDFAALYRTSAQSDALVEAFARSGIPFQKRGHNRLRDDPEVEAVVKVLAEAPVGGSVSGMVKDASVESGAGGAVLDLLLSLAEDKGDDLDGFLSEIALGAEVDAWDPRADRVSLLTLHAAKGLEFRVVFIVGVEDRLIPLRFGSEEVDVNEERRILFVGMTRAGERLVLSHAKKRKLMGRVRETAPSPFLHDIEEGLLERVKSRSGGKAKSDKARQLDLF